MDRRCATWSCDEVSVILRRYHADVEPEPISQAGYKRWRWSLPDRFDVPTETMIGRTAAEFAVACERAGVSYDRAVRREFTGERRRWTRAQCHEAVRRCADDLGSVPSAKVYERWRRGLEVPGSMPSAGSFLRRGQTWMAEVRAAGLRPQGRATDAEVEAMIAHVRRELGPSPKVREFEAFRSQGDYPLLSADQLSRRTGRPFSKLFAE